MRIIRDTEIENTIRAYIAPLFRAAGLDIGTVRITLVNDRRLNAFVTGGQHIFVHTGLLIRAEHPGQVIGVLAHEIGHIVGGHLARTKENLRNATARGVIAMVLGGAVAVASGNPAGLAAGLSAGTTVAKRSLLSYTRTMERSADQFALDLLEQTGQSARGMLEFLEILKAQEAIYSGGGDIYLRSHPLTKDRIDFVRAHLARSKYTDVPIPENLMTMHHRMRGKLIGFLRPPAQVLQTYKEDDPGIEARYARAIAYSRMHELAKGLEIVDALLKKSPRDPFLHELKGDMLTDAGRTEEAMAAYQKAIDILPWAALIRVNLARLQIEKNEPDLNHAAIANLEQALRYEPELATAWRLAATAWGRLGNRGRAAHALAEEAFLRGDREIARRRAEQAMKLLPEGSPSWLRAQDILGATDKAHK